MLDACGALACCEDFALRYRFQKRSRCTLEVHAVQLTAFLSIVLVLDLDTCLTFTSCALAIPALDSHGYATASTTVKTAQMKLYATVSFLK